MSYIDFNAVKTLAPIETVLKWYGIETKPHGEILRGSCPICKSDSARCFVVTPSKSLWYCFDECKQGGDQIQLVAFLEQCSNKEAAQKMLDRLSSKPKPRRR